MVLACSHDSVFQIVLKTFLDGLRLIPQLPADNSLMIIGQVVILVVAALHRLVCQVICRRLLHEVFIADVGFIAQNVANRLNSELPTA